MSQGAIAKLLMDMHQAEIAMQSERITTAQLRRQFEHAPTNASEDEDDDGNLLAATLSELEDSRTPSNQPLGNKVGILNGLSIEFCDGIEHKIIKLDLSPEQTERMHIWKQSLMEIASAKTTSQEDNSDIALVVQWNTKPRDEMITQQIQATNALEQKMEEKISLLQQQLAIAKTEISKEQMKTLRDQESMIVSHNMAVAGKKAESRIRRLQEQRKIEKLKEAQEIETNTLKADFESQFAELEKKYRPIFEIGESILAREREKSKPYSEHNEEIIDQGNLAAHGGNCLAVSQQMAKNSIDEDKKWFETSYGVSIENFTRHQNSSTMVKALNMQYSTIKFKFVQLSETEFESRFQLLMKKVREWEDHFEKTLGEPSESLDTFLTEDEDAVQIFSAICQVYNDAAESDKKRRKVEWKKISG
ncbi:hypothetical protein DID88_000697 [Monilinia fructigena]|uniref:Uncharacterized protein n=1 Tax=Monilinia fructigena TaxID=38457 RepID=A0A395IIP7_9HELO|nr:hypothetical protein DID88_000697 [Monilinia fructigena]